MDTGNPAKSNPTLPAELFRPIVDSGDLSNADLLSIALASRVLRDEAQRVLFREAGTFHISSWEKHLRELRRFLSAILSSPHRLGKLVRVYTQYIDLAVDGQPRRSKRNSSTDPQKDIFNMMMRSLEAMSNLRVLRLEFRNNDMSQEDRDRGSRILDCLSQCRFKLKEFAWDYKFDGLCLLEEFLVFQDDITTLELSHGFDSENASDGYTQALMVAGERSCPKLRSLRGPTSTGSVLLPGKSNVTYLSFTTPPHNTDAGERASFQAERIRSALYTIKYLEYDQGATTGFPIHDIAPYLTSLVVLKVTASQFKAVSELRNSLPTLVAVYFYSLANGHPYISDLDDLWKFAPVISNMFILHERLRSVSRAYCLMEPESYRYIACEYTYSRQTGKVMLASGKPQSESDTWWIHRVYVLDRIVNSVDIML